MNAAYICRWILATLVVFGAMQQCETFSLTRRPPRIVHVEEGTTKSLIWEFTATASEYFVTISRQRRGDPVTEQIAARTKSSAFSFASDSYKTDYTALLPSTLRLKNVQRGENYVYILSLLDRNAVLQLRDQVTVEVVAPPKITVAPVRDSVLNMRQNYTLQCNASGDPHPNITWTKDGVPVDQFNVSGHFLHLVNVQRADAGSYRCTASNGYGEDATSVSIVGIFCTAHCAFEKIGIRILSEDWKDALANQASVEFKFLESKLLSAIWNICTKNPDKQPYRVTVDRFGSAVTGVSAYVQFVFENTTNPIKLLQDEIRDGKLGSFTVDRTLIENPIPPKITVAPVRDSVLNMRQNYTLKCNASGDPHPSITWTKDGVPENQLNASGYFLHLVNVQREDAGSYRCTASNGHGEDATSVSFIGIFCTKNCLFEKVGIRILSEDWKDVLSNKKSLEFKTLESKLLSTIWSIYTKNPDQQPFKVTIDRFRSSNSVIASINFVFDVFAINPITTLRREIRDGKLGSFAVDRPLIENPMPPIITVAPVRDSILNRRLNYTLKCNASGSPHPNITWTKDGVPVNKFNVSGHFLHLVNVQREDAGSYRCTASNGYGEDATSVSFIGIVCTKNCAFLTVGIRILSEDWKDTFLNQASAGFKTLESKLLSTIWSIYIRNPDKQPYSVTVDGFRSGSVIATVKFVFEKSATNPIKPLQDEMREGKLGSLTVDRTLIENPTTDGSPEITDPKRGSSGLTEGGVWFIIGGCIVLAIL